MKKYRIIIVENDVDEQGFIKESMETSGLFEIAGIYSNGDELVESLSQHRDPLPDIIHTDLNMPGKNGYDILEYVNSHKELQQIPVVVSSTSANPQVVTKCMEKGAAAYMVKPDTFMEYDTYTTQLYKRIEEQMS